MEEIYINLFGFHPIIHKLMLSNKLTVIKLKS